MRLIFSILLYLFTSFLLKAQPNELFGKWILVRTLNNDNSRLEINNPDYSRKLIFHIDRASFKINSSTYSPVYTNDEIDLSEKRFPKFSYKLIDNYLVTRTIGGQTTSYFLKVDDFIKKYPEFQLKEVEYNSQQVYLDNEISAYEFDHKLDYNLFILFNGNPKRSDQRSNLNPESLPLQFEYVLTVDHKVKDLKIIHSENKDFDQDYLYRFKRATEFFKNTTNKDVLIRYTQNLTVSYPELKDKDEKRLFQITATADKLYSKNEFNKITEMYNEFSKLKVRPNRFTKYEADTNIIFGVSFLAQNKIKEACVSFRKVGDITDFSVRNYLLDFCQ